MLKKRLVGMVTIRQGWAVQSIGYRRYLPLGKPEVLVENLDRWGADEILIACIDRSTAGLGPDLGMLERIAALGLSTPLIYAGGLRTEVDAVKAVNLGADRVMVDALLWDRPEYLERISRELGNQAVVAHLPVSVNDGRLYWKNYRSGEECLIDEEVLSCAYLKWASEVMLTDWVHEGIPGGFDDAIPRIFPEKDKPLLLFGGLDDQEKLGRVLSLPNVVAAGIGNFLNHKEHAVQQIKRNLVGVPVRAAHYAAENF